MSKTAFLWDESFLWGLMAYRELRAHNLSFDLIHAENIKNGELAKYTLLFVPGGWASNKLKALGEEGIAEIRRFVKEGGSYLGFCGGAGLATLDGIGLLSITRKPTQERIPSFSGKIMLNLTGHAIWKGISDPVFNAWWPSQFIVQDSHIEILATYGNALPEAYSSDLNVGEVEKSGNWGELEKAYGINLNPARLLSEPAVVEGCYGKGKVLLSLIHFDTPEDAGGAIVLRNLWRYLAGQESFEESFRAFELLHFQSSNLFPELEAAIDDLIEFGISNGLWFWRSSILLQWRRGVRGLEYTTLYVLIKEIAALSCLYETGDEVHAIKRLLIPFVEKAKRLLELERAAMERGILSYDRCDDPEIQKLRSELFSTSKSHGGESKKVLDTIDAVLFKLLKAREGHSLKTP